MFLLKRLLVATDFSECSAVALTYGRALARQFHAELHVLHAVEVLAPDPMGSAALVSALPDLQADLERSERDELEALLTDDDRRDLHAKTVLATFQAPADAIVAYAREHHIDLIVLGTHGRRGVRHLVMGSVAEHVVRTAPCAVLTVRHPQFEFVVEDLAARTPARAE
jgi:nucleotide-binding universal stress UspA family protein